MSNLLHVGLILIISRVFTILCLCLLCLYRNREYRGNFQNKTVISKQLFYQTISYLYIGAMLTIIKVFIILFLLYLWEQGSTLSFFQNKSVYKLSFQLSFQIYSFLVQTEGERETFFGRVQEGGPQCNIITWLI